jgi:hypothetical protein
MKKIHILSRISISASKKTTFLVYFILFGPNSFDDATSDGTFRKASFDSMNEGMNGEENGKEEEERSDNENGRKNSHIPSKGSFA